MQNNTTIIKSYKNYDIDLNTMVDSNEIELPEEKQYLETLDFFKISYIKINRSI